MMEMPLHIAYIYANKLYLFACYIILFIMMESNTIVGGLLNMLFVFGHAQFLSAF